MGLKLYLILFLVGIMTAIGYSAKSYYTWSQTTIATLKENNVKLEQAAETLQNTITRMAEDAERNAELNRNLTARLRESQVHLDALRTRFAQIDLTMEALTDAQNLEDRVNRAVGRLINDIAKETNPNPDAATPADGVSGDQPASGTGSSRPD